MKYDIELCIILHSETQGGKGSAHFHFATAMRYVDWYIDSLVRDVRTSAYQVDAISYGEGMSCTVGEFFNVPYDAAVVQVWSKGLEMGGGSGGLCTLGEKQ